MTFCVSFIIFIVEKVVVAAFENVLFWVHWTMAWGGAQVHTLPNQTGSDSL